MKAVGIIAEYNPFHNGHKYQLEKAKEMSGADCAVIVMSGNFTQRGEIAVLDKWQRAEMAMAGGVDLVVELPFIFACNSAGFFAHGGVEILENLGVSHIAFGSETGDLERLKRIAEKLKDVENEVDIIREMVKTGKSFPSARAEALGEEGFDEPNDVLAAEYIKNMKIAEPIAIKRVGTLHNDSLPSESFASASFIRNELLKGNDISDYVPESTVKIISESGNIYGCEELLYNLVVMSVLRAGSEKLKIVFGAEEGLGDKLHNEIRYYKNYSDIVAALKSKRYTMTRVKRVIMNVIFDICKEDIIRAENYVRVLAFNDKGARFIKNVKKNGECGLPIISNLNYTLRRCPEIRHTLSKDILAADIYNLLTGRDMYEYSDYVKKPLKY